MNYQFDAFMTIVAAVAVLLVGYVCVNKVSILKKYNIPEPVAGGLVAAVITYILFLCTRQISQGPCPIRLILS